MLGRVCDGSGPMLAGTKYEGLRDADPLGRTMNLDDEMLC